MKDFDLKNYLLGVASASIVAVIIYLISLRTPGASDLEALSIDQAHKYYSTYHSHASPETEILKGFSFVTTDYYQAVTGIYSQDEGVAGYRAYMGIDDSGKAIDILVGIDAAGKDMTGPRDVIYGVRGTMGPCPNICDNSSPITN